MPTFNKALLTIAFVKNFDDLGGTLANSQVPAGELDSDRIDTSSGAFADALIPNLAASKITSGEFSTARIPNLAASKINSGTFAADRIPSLNASKITAGTFDAARIPNLNASKITAGTFPTARLADDSVTLAKMAHGTADKYLGYNSLGHPVELDAPTSGSSTFIGLSDSPSSFTASRFVKSNSAGDALEFVTLAASDIPNINASKITDGTLTDARIPNLAASKITSGEFAVARIPDLNASKIGSGNVTNDEFATLRNIRSSIQTQIDEKLSTGFYPIVPSEVEVSDLYFYSTSNNPNTISDYELKIIGDNRIVVSRYDDDDNDHNSTLAAVRVGARMEVYTSSKSFYGRVLSISTLTDGFSFLLSDVQGDDNFTSNEEVSLKYFNGRKPQDSIFTAAMLDTSTSAKMAEFRTAIGAGTSNFDGAYGSLTGAPTIPTVDRSTIYPLVRDIIIDGSNITTTDDDTAQTVSIAASGGTSGITQTQGDARYVRLTGATMTGLLRVDIDGNNTGFEVFQVDGTNKPAFFIRTNNSGDQKAFQLGRDGQGSAWCSFEGNLGGVGPGLALGPGSSGRDVRLYRSAANTLRIPDTVHVNALNIEGGPSNTEIGYVDGVTSPIQAQIDGKPDDLTDLDDTPSGYGTDGQVLTSTGSGTAWEDASGGVDGGTEITHMDAISQSDYDDLASPTSTTLYIVTG